MHFNSISAWAQYQKCGFAILKLQSVQNGICTCGNSKCTSPGKHPATPHGVKDATKNVEQLKTWLISGCNLGLATGEPSGVFVLDVDDEKALEAIESQFGKLPRTWEVKTGSGGRHLYFEFDERCRNLKNAVKFAGGLDIRATGGYVVLPPSIHASGNSYVWVVTPDECELAAAPDWLLSLIPKRGFESPKEFKIGKASTIADRCTKYLEKTPSAVSGESGQNHTFSVVCRICELFGELTDDELLDCLDEWNERCEPPWSSLELQHKLQDARSKVGTNNTPLESDSESDDDAEPETIECPVLHSDAYCGLIGEIVRAIEPETEADAVGVLLSLLTACGNAIGKRPFVSAGTAGDHGCNLFCCLVGDTASGKGVSWEIAERILKAVDNEWHSKCTTWGLSSGEGLIERVADPTDLQLRQIAPLQRLLCVETEFSRPITAMRREGNTLSAVVRNAWDGRTLEVLTRKTALRATNAFISVLAHITPHELKKIMGDSVEVYNGFANRFLWVFVQSSKSLPEGGNVKVIDQFIEPLKQRLNEAKNVGEVGRSEEFQRLWNQVYADLKASKPGTYGRAVDRARPQVLRVALIFGLLDGVTQVEEKHLRAALAVWRYCEESARILFTSDDQLLALSKHERKALELIRSRPGIMRTEVRNGVSKSLKKLELDGILKRLTDGGKITKITVHDERQADRYYPAVETAPAPSHFSKIVKSETQPPAPANALMPAAHDVHANTTAATLAELMDWRNQNSIEFAFNSASGLFWVVPQFEKLLTNELKNAIKSNQEFCKAISIEKPVEPTVSQALSEDAFMSMLRNDNERDAWLAKLKTIA